MADNCSDCSSAATGLLLLLFETMFAKEAKKRLQLLRKTPRPAKAYAGLQCVLSGNQVMFLETKHKSV